LCSRDDINVTNTNEEYKKLIGDAIEQLINVDAQKNQ
jgi:hypothetical protein